MLHVYNPVDKLYKYSLTALDFTQAKWKHITTVELIPEHEHTLRQFDTETQMWKYVRKPLDPGQLSDPLDKILTYEDIRKREYPKMEEYLDGVVKNNTEQIEAYMSQCMEVKTKWPKDMEPITLHEYFKRNGIEIHEK